MSKTESDKLLESINNNSTGGLSNPSIISNGSILLGPDSPRTVHRVTFALEPTDTNSELSESIQDELRQRCICGNYCNLLNSFSDTRRTARALTQMIYESHSANTVMVDTTQTEANITTFHDDVAAYEAGVISARDDTYYVADAPEFSLSEYFARPVRIATYSWTVGTAFPGAVLNPFRLFWENKRNVNKLATFRNLKCDMCVKILVNGTPFHYGCIQASVVPDFRTDNFTSVNLTELDAVQGSQFPHILIDPTTSTGGCLTLPFTHYYNSYDTTLAISDMSFAGVLILREIVPILHVSGTIEPVTISVMAWAKNVVLAAPTANSPTGLVAQSGDEYGQGIVSRPAFILSKIAGALRSVPYIGPYAMSTQLGAARLGSIAQIFGHVKPNVVTDIAFMNPRFQPNFASATQHDPIFKATLDDKQEVTIDPRVIGISGEDEMTIVSIATRPSYLTQFPWGQTTVVDTRLFNILVNPLHFRTAGTGLNQAYYQTPAAWVSSPFGFWRGSMKFKFTCVASAFHRGRIRIVYEPGVGLGAAAPDFNTNLTYIWDLSESKEAVIEVGWHNPASYLICNSIGDAIGQVPFSTTVTVNNPEVAGSNGSLSLYVLTELTAPDTNLAAGVSIMVSTAMCDDFEVFSPTDSVKNLEYFAQSGIVLEDTVTAPFSKMPPADVTFGNNLPVDATPAIYHGDPVLSIRTLLKRYNFTRTEGGATPGAVGTYNVVMNFTAFPLQPGRAPSAIDSAVTPINFNSMTFLNYFTPAFLARRGGLRHRFVPAASTIPFSQVTVARTATKTTGVTISPKAAMANPSAVARDTKAALYFNRAGAMGCNTTANFGDTGIDIEIPFHVPRRYAAGRDASPNGTTGISQGLVLTGTAIQSVVGFFNVAVDHYVSAGDDFSLSYFMCVPTMYVHPIVPASSP